MTGDYFMAAAVISGLLAIPSLLSSFADGRRPVMALILACLCIGFGFVAWRMTPGGYQIYDIPDVFIRVIARIMN